MVVMMATMVDQGKRKGNYFTVTLYSLDAKNQGSGKGIPVVQA